MVNLGNTYQNALNQNEQSKLDMLSDLEEAKRQALLTGDIERANAAAEYAQMMAQQGYQNANSILNARLQMEQLAQQAAQQNWNNQLTQQQWEYEKENDAYNYRFIGRVGNITGEGSTDIFEIINASNKYRKDLYDSTKELFEKAVGCYLLHDFEEARRMFTDVLRVNENDKVAVHYLMKCEEQMGRMGEGQNNKKGFTGYII